MNTRSKIKLGFSVIALGGVTLTGVAVQGLSTTAFATAAPSAKTAAKEAKLAAKAVAKRNGEAAVKHAELAVANDPTNAGYRALLGQSYMLAGRFASASQALADSLTLNPEDGKAALNLALAKVAAGDWAGARTTLQTHADHIPASDRGLAFALAGDPVTAVDILMPAARDASATAKTRQNLALSLALAGRWNEASQIAAMDVAPDQLQARLSQWAQFARPTNAYDQVASLLNVKAVEDAGQPVALALSQQPNIAVAAVQPAKADPLDLYMPKAAPAETAVKVAAVEAPVEVQPEPQQVAGTGAQVVFGAREEIVQPTTTTRRVAPVGSAAPVRSEAPVRSAKVATPSRGSFYVQLGAYTNAAVAKDAWARHTRKVAALSDATPQGARVSTRAGAFYRLSVGGFARGDADQLCRQVKASGGTCFVRAAAGDQVASWIRSGRTQVAAR